jgi:hypothetical protein
VSSAASTGSTASRSPSRPPAKGVLVATASLAEVAVRHFGPRLPAMALEALFPGLLEPRMVGIEQPSEIGALPPSQQIDADAQDRCVGPEHAKRHAGQIAALDGRQSRARQPCSRSHVILPQPAPVAHRTKDGAHLFVAHESLRRPIPAAGRRGHLEAAGPQTATCDKGHSPLAPPGRWTRLHPRRYWPLTGGLRDRTKRLRCGRRRPTQAGAGRSGPIGSRTTTT